MKKVITQDGSYTLYSEAYQQQYHSYIGAIKESVEKFIEPASFEKHSHIKLLDIGFGLGYNALWSLKKSNQPIDIISLEQDKEILSEAILLHEDKLFKQVLKDLINTGKYLSKNKSLCLELGDARNSVQNLLAYKKGFFSHVFLDAFSPDVNPELWTVQFFQNLYYLLCSEGVLITYSASLGVMSGLQKVGFYLDYTKPVGRRRGGIIAYKQASCVKDGLSEKDIFLLKHSCQGFPNIDKNRWTKEEIRSHRQKIKELSVYLKIRLSHKKALKEFLQKETNI